MKCSKGTFLYTTIAVILHVLHAKAEQADQGHCTSVAGMEKLLQLEAKFIERFSNYADELEAKLHVVRGALKQMQAESERAMEEQEYYLSNPLNAFALIRRMHQDWIDWKDYMDEPIGWSHVAFIEKHKSELPDSTDLEDACRGMQRLKDIYDMKAKDMATGLLNGKQYNITLNALDTYKLGLYFHKRQADQLAREWFTATSKWLMDHNFTHFTPIATDQTNLLYIFASALVKYKYYSIAHPIIKLALRLGNRKLDEKLLQLDAHVEKLSLEVVEVSAVPETETTKSLYKTGCRGQFEMQAKLHCQYKFNPSPFLRLAPLKMELVHLDPLIVVYYDILSPREIYELQTYARPLLERSVVYQAGKNIYQTTRTSKGTWIYREHSNCTRSIAHRLEDMTDLTLEGSEGMQILNYGLGGHYAAHYDYFNDSKNVNAEGEIDDRIATVLIYLTKVEQGGATVFPRLKQAFSPQPGMAVYWHNLHDDGTPNNRTLHGACPVLVGSKWVMTQWIEERPQMFRRPCLKQTT